MLCIYICQHLAFLIHQTTKLRRVSDLLKNQLSSLLSLQIKFYQLEQNQRDNEQHMLEIDEKDNDESN